MSRLIYDPIGGGLSLIVPSRQDRPLSIKQDSKCPFCPGGLEAPNQFDVKSFVNRWPAMEDNRCEVVLFGPNHKKDLAYYSIDHIIKVVNLWQERTNLFYSRSEIQYVLIFENRGADVGATIEHPHGQIYAFDFIPPVVENELKINIKKGCSLCEKLPEKFLAFKNSSFSLYSVPWAGWPYEVLIRSNSHISDMTIKEFDKKGFAEVFAKAVKSLDRVFNAKAPYMFFIHQFGKNHRYRKASHFHAHLLPAWRAKNVKRYVAAGELGSGVMFNPIDPYLAAESLRKKL